METTQKKPDKATLIDEILSEQDLYKILGAPRSSSPNDLRRWYLKRSKIIHPDRPPAHEESTAAFQRLSHAYEILKKPSLRAHYDRESSYVGERQGFKGAVKGVISEFLSGEFALVGRVMEKLNREFPEVVNDGTMVAIEKAFHKMREMVLTTRTYFLLISIELSRIHRVSKKLFSLGYFDVISRMRLTVQLVKVTLAAPVRVDRAFHRRREREYRARKAGRDAVGDSGGGLLLAVRLRMRRKTTPLRKSGGNSHWLYFRRKDRWSFYESRVTISLRFCWCHRCVHYCRIEF
ncbi:DnaJ-domain-containing protein [Choiromyces venosus 120613-1]|uniref:DnaJ-domain-containing protein n=1 Tax=Choiromyces venosus 120613-1 TaxID=1336337 RepID=A0A3N4J7Z6_9PEZI|nr:DnaJ-domain-containing protein [Choiromyces venosus 120613-1]